MAKFRERPGWMTSLWFRSLRSIPNHEAAALRHLHAGCICCRRAWRCRGLGASSLETGAGLLFLAWALWIYFTKEEQIVFSPLIPPLAALSLIVLGQRLFHGTASSYSTRMELLLLVSDVILLFLALQAFRTLQDWRGFIWFGMIFGFLVSLFGVLQHLTFNGKLYWFRDMV